MASAIIMCTALAYVLLRWGGVFQSDRIMAQGCSLGICNPITPKGMLCSITSSGYQEAFHLIVDMGRKPQFC